MNYLYKKKDNFYICYNILYNDKPIDYYKIHSILNTNKYELDLTDKIEIGPIPNFTSSLSSNIMNIYFTSNPL